MTDLPALLRAETITAHERLEALPFFKALYAGTLPKLSIVSFLRCLAIVHAVLEREIFQNSDPDVAKLGQHVRPKVPLLITDLKALDAETLPSITPAIQSGIEFGAEILTNANNPLSLVGTLYVLEGSQNGGVLLKQAYARCLNMREEQPSYFGCYGSTTATHWKEFSDLLTSLVLSDEEAKLVARSAIRCFDRIDTLCMLLYPYSSHQLKHHVVEINFEAGDHAMPQDPLEIVLALRAGRAAWERYPYLDRRFAERGKRFTSSDSCWLLTLTRMPVETATRSLEWLRRVLSSRGIPTVILEGHLRAIAEALAVEFPEQVEMRTRFDRFLSNLQAERQAIGGSETVAHLVELFDRRFHACAGLTVDSAAELIASAWIDERSGIPGAMASTLNWFVDTERFSSEWIANANELATRLNQVGGSTC